MSKRLDKTKHKLADDWMIKEVTSSFPAELHKSQSETQNSNKDVEDLRNPTNHKAKLLQYKMYRVLQC